MGFYCRLGAFFFGMDLRTWGIGFVQSFKFPRGFGAHLGPFFLKIEGAELWDDFCNFVDDQLCKLEHWLERRRGERGGE